MNEEQERLEAQLALIRPAVVKLRASVLAITFPSALKATV